MRTKDTLFMLLVLVTVNAQAQWTTSGTNIYNSNTGSVGIGTGSTIPTGRLYVKTPNASISTFVADDDSERVGFGLYGYLPSQTSNTYLKRTMMLYGSGTHFKHLNIVSNVSNGTIRFLVGGWENISYQRMIIDSAGNVGIGTNSPGYLLDVNGTIRAVSVIQTSDERLKDKINKIQNPLLKIENIDGITYTFKPSNNPDRILPENEQIGLSAQQVRKILPSLVSEDKEGYLSVNYIGLIPVLVESIKELKSQVDYLKASIITDSEADNSITKSNIRLNVYPNPLKSETTFEFNIPDEHSNAQIRVYNLNGKEIKTIDISNKTSGKISLIISADPGLYLCSLIIDNDLVIVKRMIIESN